MVKKVISGGQTGVDQAALKGATLMNVVTGGWAPHNWMTESGSQKSLLSAYGLKADRYDSKTYHVRTESNVNSADGTLIITWGLKSLGTTLTKSTCIKNNSLFMVLEDPTSSVAIYEIVDWIIRHKIRVLNIAGPRESIIGKIPTETTVNLIMKVLKALSRYK